MPREARLTERTWIPIGLAVVVIGGGAAWMTRQEFLTTKNAENLSSVEHRLDKVCEKLGKIEDELRKITRSIE